MSLTTLNIHKVRNITKAQIKPSPTINLIIGENSSGKSSLLESIFILGRASSFRTNHPKKIIQNNSKQLIVSGQVSYGKTTTNLGVELGQKTHTIKINQTNSNKATLAHSLPLSVIHPKSYQLLDAGPQARREFLDWGLFNNDNNFLHLWRKFNRSLQHRNLLLRTGKTKQLSIWDAPLIKYGELVCASRQEYINILQPIFLKLSAFFLGQEDITIKYLNGWGNTNFALATKLSLDKDLRYGFTHNGPHRADFLVVNDGGLVKDYLSRGQLKLIIISLKLAQIELIAQEKNRIVCLLIDDVAAELDTLNKKKLLNYLGKLNYQIFMSSTELANFGDITTMRGHKIFSMKQGEINKQN